MAVFTFLGVSSPHTYSITTAPGCGAMSVGQAVFTAGNTCSVRPEVYWYKEGSIVVNTPSLFMYFTEVIVINGPLMVNGPKQS